MILEVTKNESEYFVTVISNKKNIYIFTGYMWNYIQRTPMKFVFIKANIDFFPYFLNLGKIQIISLLLGITRIIVLSFNTWKTMIEHNWRQLAGVVKNGNSELGLPMMKI